MAAVDGYDRLPANRLVGPYRYGEAVTPHASNDFTHVSRAIYVGGAGDIAVVLVDNTVLTFKAVPVGTVLNVQARRVNAVNTTATLMLALW